MNRATRLERRRARLEAAAFRARLAMLIRDVEQGLSFAYVRGSDSLEAIPCTRIVGAPGRAVFP